MSVHIGTSGWSYDHWQDILYPHGTSRWHRLPFYVSRYSTAELNSSFYKWPTVSAFKSWQQRLPPGFILSVKAPRGLTHAQRLYAPEKWMERIKSCWHELGDKRGILLVQLPPGLSVDYERLHYFLQQVPRWMRVAIEFRHPAWHQESIFTLLEEYGAAYCVMSGAQLPCVLRATASFVYVRMHGPDHGHLYAGSYSHADLEWWASRVAEWEAQGRDVYVYFNNDGGANAVHNATTLRGILGR